MLNQNSKLEGLVEQLRKLDRKRLFLRKRTLKTGAWYYIYFIPLDSKGKPDKNKQQKFALGTKDRDLANKTYHLLTGEMLLGSSDGEIYTRQVD